MLSRCSSRYAFVSPNVVRTLMQLTRKREKEKEKEAVSGHVIVIKEKEKGKKEKVVSSFLEISVWESCGVE